jgi:beta-xylosidase
MDADSAMSRKLLKSKKPYSRMIKELTEEKMKHATFKCLIFMMLGCMLMSTGVSALVDNPLLKNVRTADASPLVYNGRFYIVCGQDETNSTAFNMYAWRLMSSADMNTWTDHGVIARPTGWMPANRAWASSLVYHNGRFYLYIATDWAVGVMTASNITGPYTDPLGKPLIDANTPGHAARDIDPCCYIDSDGKAYLFWGGDGICRYARLNSDMISLATEVMDVPGLTGSGYTYLEAPFVIKSGNTYFLMYADQPWPSNIRYATSGSISGPWTHRGIIGERTGNGTNHEGAAYFNGQWWYTYHTEELSNGNPYSRSVCVDKMTINGGTISPIGYTSFGMTGGGVAPQTGVTYMITNRNSWKLLEVANAATADGGNVQQYTNNTHNCQRWKLESAGDGYYRIVNVNSGKLLEVGNALTTDGANVRQWPNNGHSCQQWRLQDAGDGFYYLVNRNSGKVLDISGKSMANGGNAIQYSHNGGANQQWKFVQ